MWSCGCRRVSYRMMSSLCRAVEGCKIKKEETIKRKEETNIQIEIETRKIQNKKQVTTKRLQRQIDCRRYIRLGRMPMMMYPGQRRPLPSFLSYFPFDLFPTVSLILFPLISHVLRLITYSPSLQVHSLGKVASLVEE